MNIRASIQFAVSIAALVTMWSRASRACDDNAWRVVMPVEITRLDSSAMNARLAAVGYAPFAQVRTAIPLPELQVTCGRMAYSVGLFRYVPPLHAVGPTGSAAVGGGSIVPFEIGFVALQRDNWEIASFAGAGLGLSYLTLPKDGPLPAHIYASQGRFDLPVRLGLRFTRTLDTSGAALFGYSESGRQGAGPTLTLEVGFAATLGAPWYEDSQGIGSGPRSDVPALGTQGPFARLAVGWGAWHVGRGPWR
jgi:hypothetical protein